LKYQSIADIINGNSKDYPQSEIDEVGDLIVALPDDLAFEILKRMATKSDLCERLLLKRTDIFNILKTKR